MIKGGHEDTWLSPLGKPVFPELNREPINSRVIGHRHQLEPFILTDYREA